MMKFVRDHLAVIPVKILYLLVVSTGGFVPTHIMHCLTVKLSAVFGGSSAACRVTAVVALAIVELMIDVAVEMIRPVIPGASADEDTASSEPLGPIIAIGSAVIRRSLVIPVGANGCYSDADCNLCMSFIGGNKQNTGSDRH